MKNKSQYQKNPFKVEYLRDQLALKKLTKDFIKTYKPESAEILNLNDKTFWNQHFDTESNLNDQDDMTKDKILRIIKLIPNKNIRILDLGFGQGYFEEGLKSSHCNCQLYGLDISSVAVKKQRKNLQVNLFKEIFLKLKII